MSINLKSLGNSDLLKLQKEIEKELKLRKKSINFLETWVEEADQRAVKYTTHQTTVGWIAILMVFSGDNYETFKCNASTREESVQLVANMAVMSSTLVDVGMEIMT